MKDISWTEKIIAAWMGAVFGWIASLTTDVMVATLFGILALNAFTSSARILALRERLEAQHNPTCEHKEAT